MPNLVQNYLSADVICFSFRANLLDSRKKAKLSHRKLRSITAHFSLLVQPPSARFKIFHVILPALVISSTEFFKTELDLTPACLWLTMSHVDL